MAVSKNNPDVRDKQTLIVRCPDCDSPMKLTRRVGFGLNRMFYICQKDGQAFPVVRGSYRDLPHEWVTKGGKRR